MRQIIIDFGTVNIFGWHAALRIYGYGLMLVLGFLTAILIGQRRARRCGENPETLTQCGIIALVGGVLGARIAYVIEQAIKHPEMSPKSLLDIVDVTSGGLIYFGGLILAMLLVLVYLFAKRLPVRRYLDILAPSLMIGLAFGRAGCLLNGCCYGGLCDAHWPLAQTFPMYSKPLLNLSGNGGPFVEGQGMCPSYADQYRNGTVKPDERLVNRFVSVPSVLPGGKKVPLPLVLSVGEFHGRLYTDQLTTMLASPEEARSAFVRLAGSPEARLDEQTWQKDLARGDGFLRGSEQWNEAAAFDSDHNGRLSFDEAWKYLQTRLQLTTDKFDADGDWKLNDAERTAANEYLQADLNAIASDQHTLPVRPAQALGIINALLLACLLAAYGRRRTREGQVFAMMLILYPITRFLEELVRADNPHNLLAGVLTHNQYTSIALLALGVIMMMRLRRLGPSCGPGWTQRLELAAQDRGQKRG
ncbi:MAG: prolipoprotein diacylglyceryl transferase [Planctomycetes bacterium]|nr:prolipoprotein diacylglyceryl transferase [Planctomycetota bacterium]